MTNLAKIFFIFAAILLPLVSSGQNGVQEEKNSIAGKSDISYFDSVVLGLVEGITEYLPVSSTGHLIIANAFLNLDGDKGLSSAEGTPVLASDGEPYTMKMAADAYAIVIQFGAIMAVVVLYWDCLVKMLFGLFGRDAEGLRLFRNLVVAFIPAALVGLLFHDAIEEYLFGVAPVIIALAAGAALMFFVQKFYDARAKKTDKFTRMEDMTARQALVVGLLQCVAMWPGTSRSMMTILGGYIVGFKPADAARFSFLLGLATLSAASLFKVAKDGANMAAALSPGPLAVGLIVAFFSSAISVRWLVGFLTRKGLKPFVWYRIFVAILLAVLLWSGAF